MAWSTALIALALASSSQAETVSNASTLNSNHIFNAIHSSMRQWGSSLNHNGMSLFMATVPQGTQFYHGTRQADRINGTEWLAFEPEHATQFARCGRGSPPGKGGPPGSPPHTDDSDLGYRPDDDWHPPQQADEPPKYMDLNHGDSRKMDLKARHAKHERPMSHTALQRARAGMHFDQEPMEDDNEQFEPEDEEDCHGYLHTYTPKRDLRLLYIDGQSAAKSAKGTLDSQDIFLLHSNPPPSDGEHGPPPEDKEGQSPSRQETGRKGPASQEQKGRGPHHEEKKGHSPPPSDGEHGPPPHEKKGHSPPHQEEEGKHPSRQGKKGHSPRPQDNDGKRSPPQDREGKRPGGPMNESYRAEKLCEMAQNEWQGRIDGFLRMELGFEIILCNFERDLDVERITAVKQSGGMGPGSRDSGDELSYYQAVASRFDDIGGGRVHVNYDDFVTLFAADGAVSFDKEGLPRINNVTKVLNPVLEATKEMILRKEENNSVDWQAVADMVISRYSDRIEYLASGDLKDLNSFRAEVDRAIRPFIDYTDRNKTIEIQRCASQYIPGFSASTNLAARAIANVTTTICTALSNASEKEIYTNALHTVRDLKSWLAWSTWKRCRGCGPHEVCLVPIWPTGGQADYDHPKCVSNMSQTDRGYWGGMHPHGEEKREWHM